MDNNEDEKDIKLIVVGDAGVGKSCIINRLIQNIFDPDNLSTFGVMHHVKKFTKDKINYKINIWDTAGQEVFSNVTSYYYRDSQIAIVVFDLKNDVSKNNVIKWIKQVKNKNKDEIVIYIFCNKFDLDKNYKVDKNFMQEISKYNGILFYTSAKQNIGLSNIFDKIINDVTKLGIENDNNIKKRETIQVEKYKNQNNNKDKKKRCCNN